MNRFIPVLCVAAFLLCQSASKAELILNVTQSGNDVVVTASGSINSLAGLMSVSLAGPPPTISASEATVRAGSGAFDVYAGLTSAPSSIGSGPEVTATSSTGPQVGVTDNAFLLEHGYVLGTSLDSTATYASESFASLGLTPGTSFTYSWTGDSAVVNVVASAVPEPASVVMLSTGVLVASAVVAARRLQANRPQSGLNRRALSA